MQGLESIGRCLLRCALLRDLIVFQRWFSMHTLGGFIGAVIRHLAFLRGLHSTFGSLFLDPLELLVRRTLLVGSLLGAVASERPLSALLWTVASKYSLGLLLRAIASTCMLSMFSRANIPRGCRVLRTVFGNFAFWWRKVWRLGQRVGARPGEINMLSLVWRLIVAIVKVRVNRLCGRSKYTNRWQLREKLARDISTGRGEKALDLRCRWQ